jgi:hypothetical protein
MEQDALREGLSGSGREHLQFVENKFPKKVKRAAMNDDEEEEEAAEGTEYYDYIFPDDEKKPG